MHARVLNNHPNVAQLKSVPSKMERTPQEGGIKPYTMQIDGGRPGSKAEGVRKLNGVFFGSLERNSQTSSLMHRTIHHWIPILMPTYVRSPVKTPSLRLLANQAGSHITRIQC